MLLKLYFKIAKNKITFLYSLKNINKTKNFFNF